MDGDSKRRVQLAVGFAVFAAAVALSYFSAAEGDTEPAIQDIVLVMDVSGSMADENKLGFAQEAAYDFVDVFALNASSGHMVGMVTFADAAEVAVALTGDGSELKQGISGLRAGGGTAMWDGIASAMAMLEQGRPGVEKTIVLLGDGMSNAGRPPNLMSLAGADTVIFSVGYGESADVATLRTVASMTDGEYFDAPTGQDLADTFGSIAESIISPVSHYSSRVMMLVAIPVLLFIPAIEAGLTTMMGRADLPVRRNLPKRPCPHCEHLNREAALFCVRCGKGMEGGAREDDAPVRRNLPKRPCPHCEHLNREAALFCVRCGKGMATGGGTP